jgi:putative ABC transport system ATP-binding protein
MRNLSMRDPSQTTLFECRGVGKSYMVGETRFSALQSVDLRIDAGEFVAITGPSGSGKSTLLNLLGTLDIPTQGTLMFRDRDLSELDDKALAELRNRHIGFVFQNFNLLARATLLQNVALPLVYAGYRTAERHARAMELLTQVGLAAHARKLPSQLSGGQQQRVAIARALVNRPQVMLADEPTGNLDRKTGDEIMALMRTLNQDSCVTIVLVTHDPDLSRSAQRVLEFADGSMVSDSASTLVAP